MPRRIAPPLPGAFALSLAVWLAVSAGSGGGEAWDADTYWRVGLPVIYVGAGALASRGTGALWTVWLATLLGQFCGLLASASGASLWPLGLILLAFLSLPVVLVAAVLRRLRRRSTS